MNGDLGAAVRMVIDGAGQERVARYEAKLARDAAERAAKKKRRDAGLIARHAAKLGRRKVA